MTTLSIFVEPQVGRAGNGALDWTLANLLVGMGYAWRRAEVPDGACDLAYVRDPATSTARVTIVATPGGWPVDGSDRLLGSFTQAGASWPRFASTPEGAPYIAKDGRLLVRHDLLRDMFQLLAGHAERSWPMDRHGRYSLDADGPSRAVLPQALVSGMGAWLQARVEELTGSSGLPRWPAGRRAAVCLTHDVDYPEPVRWLEPLRVMARQGIGGVSAGMAVASGRRHHWHFPSWMAVERAAGVRSAFYFSPTQGSLLGRALGTPDVFYDVAAPRFRAQMAELTELGFEVGLHVSYRACESPGGVAAERRRLQAAAGTTIAGCRHHYWRLLPGDPASTLREHETAGLDYDCSLFHDRYVGWRRGSSWPFFPYDEQRGRALRTLQVPTGWMDDQFFGMRADNPGDPEGILAGLIDTALVQQGCFAADVHEYVFDDALYPGWAKLYRTFVELAAGNSDVWVATPQAVAAHWRERAQTLTAASQPQFPSAACPMSAAG